MFVSCTIISRYLMFFWNRIIILSRLKPFRVFIMEWHSIMVFRIRIPREFQIWIRIFFFGVCLIIRGQILFFPPPRHRILSRRLQSSDRAERLSKQLNFDCVYSKVSERKRNSVHKRHNTTVRLKINIELDRVKDGSSVLLRSRGFASCRYVCNRVDFEAMHLLPTLLTYI